MLIRRIARPLLSVAFIGQGVDALRNPKPAADAARPALDGMRQLPDPIGPKVPTNAETFARANAAVQVGGGLLLATGKLPRLASAALAFTVIPGSVGGHMFWNEADPQRKADERRAFLTDLSLLGGLIIAAVDTEGKPSLGWRGRRAARKVSEAVSSALPVGAASGGTLADSAIAEKLGHGLQIGAERGREFAHVARERGADIKVNAPASRILIKDGRAKGVVLENGEEYQSQVVASCLDANVTVLNLIDPKELPASFREPWRELLKSFPLGESKAQSRTETPQGTGIRDQGSEKQASASTGNFWRRLE